MNSGAGEKWRAEKNENIGEQCEIKRQTKSDNPNQPKAPWLKASEKEKKKQVEKGKSARGRESKNQRPNRANGGDPGPPVDAPNGRAKNRSGSARPKEKTASQEQHKRGNVAGEKRHTGATYPERSGEEEAAAAMAAAGGRRDGRTQSVVAAVRLCVWLRLPLSRSKQSSLHRERGEAGRESFIERERRGEPCRQEA